MNHLSPPILNSRSLLAASAFFAAMISSSIGAVLVSDDFTTDASSRAVGTTLNDIPAQKGAASWVVPSNASAVFSPDGTAIAGADLPSCQALVAIQDPTTKITVQADVIVQGSGWVGVGFQTSDRALWFSPGNLLFVNLNPSGGWVLYRDQGALHALASGTVANFSPADKYTLGLEYDPATSMASVFVNGENVSSAVDTSFPISTEIGSAGFFIYPSEAPAGTAQVDDFQVVDASK